MMKRRWTLPALAVGLSLAGAAAAYAAAIPYFQPNNLFIPGTAADFNTLIGEINAGGGTVISGVSTVTGSGGISCSPTSGNVVCSGGATGFPIVLGSTSVASGSTTTTFAGMTQFSKIII